MPNMLMLLDHLMVSVLDPVIVRSGGWLPASSLWSNNPGHTTACQFDTL